jgi:hypothetical protein
MIPLALIVGLFVLYMLLSKHAGPAHLASVAGVSVNELFGGQVTNFIMSLAHSLPRDVVSKVVYVALVFGFPMILYFKSAKEKRHLTTIVENAIFAILMAELIITPFVSVMAVDALGKACVKFVEISLPFVVVAGTITAYVDILLYRDHRKHKRD